MLFGENFFEDGSDGKVVVNHDMPSNFFRSQVAVDRLGVDKILEEDAHDLGVFLGEALLDKELPNAGHSDVVSVVYFVCLDPLNKFFQTYLHLIFFDDILYVLRIILDLVLQPSEEHPQQV